jgi:hypothetical protein
VFKKLLKNKKLFLIIGAVVLLAILGFFVFIVFSSQKRKPAVKVGEEVSFFNLTGSWVSSCGEVIKNVCLVDGKLYAAANYGGLLVLDSKSMALLGSFTNEVPVLDIIVRTNFTNRYIIAALGANNNKGGIAIFDVNSSANIFVTNSFQGEELSPQKIAAFSQDDRIYTADNRDGMRSYKINLQNLSINTNSFVSFNEMSASGIALKGHVAFVAALEKGVYVIDLDKNVILANLSFDLSIANSVSVSGNTLAVADRIGGIILYDISNPRRPERIANYDTPGDAYDVWMDGNDIYIADGINGILKTKWSSPDRFTLLKYYNDGSLFYKIFVSTDGLIYASCGQGGIKVLQ